MLSRRKRALFEAILGLGRGIIATLKSSDGDFRVARRLFCACRTASLLCKVMEKRDQSSELTKPKWPTSVTKSATLVKLGKCGEEAFVKTIHNFLQMPSSEGAIFFANYFAFSSFCSIFAG